MSLQGTLDTFSVADVLPVLERGTKTGALRVRGETGSGILHLVDGRLVGAESEALRGAVATDAELRVRLLDVGFVLFREHRGTFEFDDSWRPPADSAVTGVTVDEVLDRVGRVVAEWAATAEGRGIDVDARVSLVGELAGETITLDRAAWRVVRAVGPDTTLRQVAAALGASIVETAFALRAMSADGIVIVGGAAPGGAVTGLDAFATTASVTPAAFDPAAFDPATYDPAEHEPVEWSAQAGTHGYADEPAGLGAEALALGADVAALQAAARDLRIREEHEAWAAAQPAEPVEAEFRPDRTSAFARLATERTEAELRAQAEAEEAARAGFALAVDDIDLLPGAHAADATYAEPGAEDAPEFDPDAYAPLSFDAPSFEAPPLTNLAGEPIGQAAYADPAPAYAEPAYVETDFVAEGYTEADYLAPEPGAADPADPGFEEYEAESDADPESPRAGEPKDRGALLRMFSALREG